MQVRIEQAAPCRMLGQSWGAQRSETIRQPDVEELTTTVSAPANEYRRYGCKTFAALPQAHGESWAATEPHSARGVGGECAQPVEVPEAPKAERGLLHSTPSSTGESCLKLGVRDLPVLTMGGC